MKTLRAFLLIGLVATTLGAQSPCNTPDNLMPDCGFDFGIEGWQAAAGTIIYSADGGAVSGSLANLSESVADTFWTDSLFCLALSSAPPILQLGFSYRQTTIGGLMSCGYSASFHSSADCSSFPPLPGSTSGSLELSTEWSQHPSELLSTPSGTASFRLELACQDTEHPDYELRIDDVFLRDASAGTGSCVPDATTLCIDDQAGDGRFRITMTYETAIGGGLSGDAQALPLGTLGVSRGGLLYFQNKANPEVLIKVLDGCNINGNFWVFFAATTTLGFELIVEDTLTDTAETWSNQDGVSAAPVSDVEAFSCSN